MRNVHVSPWLAVLLALSASPPASSQQRLEADLYAAHIAMTLVPRVQSYRRERVRFGDAQPVPLMPVRVRQAGTVPHGG